jgi:hypothetical protein
MNTMSDTYPSDPPDPRDPRPGDALEEWQPSTSQRARAIELGERYAARDTEFAALFNAYCRDVLDERSLPQTLLAVLEHGTVSLIGCQGEDLTIKRFASDVEHARKDIIEFGGLS